MSDNSPVEIDLEIPGISDAMEIGRGGFGVVYRAVEADLGRTVAVKILSGNLDEAGRIRFDRERRAMGTLSGHPNIVTIYRSGYTPAGNAYLVMEYLLRGSLAGRIRAHGPIPWPEVLALGIQLSGALETSHRAGVLHRDIKPGNILLSNLGSAKLCDFGIARLQGAPETQSAVFTASLAHAPPDVVNGLRPDARSDVYSLASTLYELITGRPPFVRPSDESMVPILARINQDPVPPWPEAGLPAPLFRVIEQAMAKDPNDRPPTALAFGQMLVEGQQQLGVTPTPIPIETIDAGTDSGPSTSPYANRSPSSPVWAPPAPPMVAGATGSSVSGAAAGQATATSAVGLVHPRRRPPASWLAPVAATVLAVVILGGLVAWRASQDHSAIDTSQISATAESGPGTSVVTANVNPPVSPTVTDTYLSYQDLSDQSGSITLKVPDEWTKDVDRRKGKNGQPFLAAAPKLEGSFFNSLDGAGVAVGLYADAIEPSALLLDQGRQNAKLGRCTSGGDLPFDGVYDGHMEVFKDCEGTDTILVHVALVDRDAGISAFVLIQAPTDKDFAAVNTIVDSIRLRDNR